MDVAPVGSAPGFAVLFAVGLLGGAHCLGMCGPLVTTYADRLGGREDALTRRELRGHLLFNAGRTTGYAAVGGALGLAGGLVFEAASIVAIGDVVRGAVGVAVGLAVLVAGLGYLAAGANVLGRYESARLGAAFARVTGVIADRLDAWVRGPRIVALGALHGLLPCPILYPAFLYAFATGSAATGAVSLAVLGLGTVPALFLYGAALGTLGPTTRRRIHRVMGVAFVALAAVPLAHGLSLLGVAVPTLGLPFYRLPG